MKFNLMESSAYHEQEDEFDSFNEYDSSQYNYDDEGRQNINQPMTNFIITCKFCRKSFNNSYDHKNHEMSHKSNDGIWHCSFCQFSSPRKAMIEIHIRKHTGHKHYSCTICSYQCFKKWDIERHIKTHTGEKEFVCSFCSYSTSHKWMIKKHYRAVHSLEFNTF